MQTNIYRVWAFQCVSSPEAGKTGGYQQIDSDGRPPGFISGSPELLGSHLLTLSTGFGLRFSCRSCLQVSAYRAPVCKAIRRLGRKTHPQWRLLWFSAAIATGGYMLSQVLATIVQSALISGGSTRPLGEDLAEGNRRFGKRRIDS